MSGHLQDDGDRSVAMRIIRSPGRGSRVGERRKVRLLFDHLVGAREQGRRHFETEHLRSDQIDGPRSPTRMPRGAGVGPAGQDCLSEVTVHANTSTSHCWSQYRLPHRRISEADARRGSDVHLASVSVGPLPHGGTIAVASMGRRQNGVGATAPPF
jgi:hypothetical protein